MPDITNDANPDPHDDNTTQIFGRSVESQVQLGKTGIDGEAGEPLTIYELKPIAAPDDPRWQGGPSDVTIRVAARTTGDARIVAVGSEIDFMDVAAAPAEGVSTAFASMFRDDKLYTVIEIERGRTDLARGVLDGTAPTETISPVQKV